MYAREIDITNKSAQIFAETQVKNELPAEKNVELEVKIEDPDGKIIKTFKNSFIKHERTYYYY